MKKGWSLVLILLLTVCMAAGAENSGTANNEWEEKAETTAENESEWDEMDNNRVFYEIFVGSFSDSDGDGTGDLRGVINRMDYLNDGASGKGLGIEGIWLTPVFASPTYHKYDVTDYYAIDPRFGTIEDLEELIAACHARGVKLILDLPLNHTGVNCRWYKNFLNAHLMQNPGNSFYDFYTWLPGDEKAPAGRQFMQENNRSPLDAMRMSAQQEQQAPVQQKDPVQNQTNVSQGFGARRNENNGVQMNSAQSFNQSMNKYESEHQVSFGLQKQEKQNEKQMFDDVKDKELDPDYERKQQERQKGAAQRKENAKNKQAQKQNGLDKNNQPMMGVPKNNK